MGGSVASMKTRVGRSVVGYGDLVTRSSGKTPLGLGELGNEKSDKYRAQ